MCKDGNTKKGSREIYNTHKVKMPFIYLFVCLFILVFAIEKYIGKNCQEELKTRI